MTISTSDPENGGETFTRGVTPAALEATVFILRKLPAKGEEARVESRMLLVLLTCSVLVSLYPQPPRALVGLGVPLGGLYPHLAVVVTGGREVVEVGLTP